LAVVEDTLSAMDQNTETAHIVTMFRGVATDSTTSSGFAWTDGSLIDALRTGGWFHITDANLCSPSVLDRLNSLCETDGVLVLSEKGSSSGGAPEVIKPHTDFRLFMSYDPRYGELSRAMRNRGVELYVPEGDGTRKENNAALADDSTMRSITTYSESCSAQTETAQPIPTASVVANTVSAQCPAAMPLMKRLPSVDRELFVGATLVLDSGIASDMDSIGVVRHLPDSFAAEMVSPDIRYGRVADLRRQQSLDPSINPYNKTSSSHVVFRLLQLHLRNTMRQKELAIWLGNPLNAKSVLAVSARGLKPGRRSQKTAGSEVWPLVSLYRQCLAEIHVTHVGGASAVSTQNVWVDCADPLFSPTWEISSEHNC
jgi:midasin